ncbi:unnamed protein product [Bemisia tabaci]|uniref:DUF3456 domain-containing protein n=1 Tax=Bemisia tabaci TaxID=7038 RepID=A0A9P0ADQ4_BEMTA|nr:unnamed protein product [Bemisia tabaci]
MQKFVVSSLTFLFFLICSSDVIAQGKNHEFLKCLVCEKIVEEVKLEINKPEVKGKKIAVGGYHLDDKGNTNQREIPYQHSDVFLNEVLDNICEKMKDYVRVRRKSDDKLMLIPLVLPGGAMNPLIGDVDPILDDDLNKSLGHYCQEITNEYDEEIIESLKRTPSDELDESSFCSSVLPYCDGVEEIRDSGGDRPRLEDIIGSQKEEL